MRFVCLDENCTWEMEGEYVSRSSPYIRQHEETLGGGHRVVRASEVKQD